MRVRVFALVAACLVALAACGVRPSDAIPAGDAPVQQATVRSTLYWVNDLGLVAYPRMTATKLGPQEAVSLLMGGPTPAESSFGMRTALPMGTHAVSVSIAQDVMDVYLGVSVSTLSPQAVDQVVCTAAAAQGGGIEVAVNGDGERLDPRGCGG